MLFRVHFTKFISSSDNVFRVEVSMKLCELKSVLGGYLYRFISIVDTGIDDNVVIKESIQR